MRIVTLTCPDCGTVVAGNELERERVLHCPGLACDTVLTFEALPESDREYLTERTS
jgi:hypothetical protein